MQKIKIEGFKTILRPVELKDLPHCQKWLEDKETQKLLNRSPVTWEEELKWFQSIQNNPKEFILAIETKEGVYLGNIGIHNINTKHQTCISGAFLGNKNYQGKGYGTDAKMFFLNYIFKNFKIRKIHSVVNSFNHKSLCYLLHTGHQIEGIKKESLFYNGKYYDQILLGLFKKDWERIWKHYKQHKKVPKKAKIPKEITLKIEI